MVKGKDRDCGIGRSRRACVEAQLTQSYRNPWREMYAPCVLTEAVQPGAGLINDLQLWS